MPWLAFPTGRGLRKLFVIIVTPWDGRFAGAVLRQRVTHLRLMQGGGGGTGRWAAALPRVQALFCQARRVPLVTILEPSVSGIGYSFSLRTKPGLLAKSRRGGQKMS